MTDLQFVQVPAAEDSAVLLDWQRIHNLIVPIDPLEADEIAERAGRNHLEVAYADGVAVGCSTVRPPADGAATVIARVLAEHRRQGFGELVYRRGLERAREFGVHDIATVVLESSADGLRFALAHGFTEVERYLLPGDTIAFVDLRLT